MQTNVRNFSPDHLLPDEFVSNQQITVRQANELIQASYKIPTIGENRFIRMLISQISQNDEDFKIYRISVSEFQKIFNLTHNDVYAQIQKVARSLREREVLIKKGKSWLVTGWLSHAEYIEGNGFIEVSFHSKLKPYLLGMKEHYTQYTIDKIVNFKSGYSIRLFEILKKEQFKNNAGFFVCSYTYDELRKIFSINNDEYAFFKDFRVRIIDKSVLEINKYSDIFVYDIVYVKLGRKIDRISFMCKENKKEGIESKKEDIEKNHKKSDTLLKLLSFGISENSAKKILIKHDEDVVLSNIKFMELKIKQGKNILDKPAYIISAIENNYALAVEIKNEVIVNTSKNNNTEDRKFIDTALNLFYSMPEIKKIQIRKAYLNTLPDDDPNKIDFLRICENSPYHRRKFVDFFTKEFGETTHR